MWEKSEPWDAAAVVMAVNFNAQRVLRCWGPEKPSGKIGAWPAGASQRHQRPSSLLRDKKGEDPRVVGGKELGLLGGRTRERACERRESRVTMAGTASR